MADYLTIGTAVSTRYITVTNRQTDGYVAIAYTTLCMMCCNGDASRGKKNAPISLPVEIYQHQ